MKTFLFTVLLLLQACSAPQWRVGQAEVPPPLAKPKIQLEAERKAADLLAREVTEPMQMQAVAEKLSASLGAPDKPIVATDLDKARDEALLALLKGMQQQQDALAKLNAQLAKYEGKKIEGTGFNLFGFAVSAPVIALIVVCVMFPSTTGVLLWLWRRASGALTSTIKGIQKYKSERPEESGQLVEKLDRAQDESHKTLVRKLKSKLRNKNAI